MTSHVPRRSPTDSDVFGDVERARHAVAAGAPNGREAAVATLEKYSDTIPDARYWLAHCLLHDIGVHAKAESRAKYAWDLLMPLIKIEYVPAMVMAALWRRDFSHITRVRDTLMPFPGFKNERESVLLLDRVLFIIPTHPVALCARAMAYLHGKGSEKNESKGIKYLLRAVEMRHIEATGFLGNWLVTRFSRQFPHRQALNSVSGRSEPRRRSLKTGVKLLHAAAAAGCQFAHLSLSYFMGSENLSGNLAIADVCWPDLSFSERLQKADWHEHRAAEEGSGYAYLCIGEQYSIGDQSHVANFEAACRYFVLAIRAHVLGAYDALGWHFETGGEGSATDKIHLRAAFCLYEQGYQAREAAATLHLAEAYDDGVGVIVDTERAERLYNEAISMGRAEGCSSVVAEAKQDLGQLFLAQNFLSHYGVEYEEKLCKLLGAEEARARIRRTRDILKQGQSKSRARRTPNRGEDHARKRLSKLVGDRYADELIASFFAKNDNEE